MKKIILLIAIFVFISCKKDCDEEKAKLHADYITALQNAGGSTTAQNEVTRQYNERLASLNERCD